jgi:hypothetical protein
MKKIAIILALMVLLPISAQAIPSLGVISTNQLSTWDGTGHSFQLTDTSISVWWGNPSGTLDDSIDIFLATTASGSFSFGGSPLTSLTPPSPDQADGYFRPYQALNLETAAGWTQATSTNAPALAAAGDFRFLTGDFVGSLGAGEWLFALADKNKNGIVYEDGKDGFSPQTTSTVPEPGSLLMLGAGLISLWGFGALRTKEN